MTLPVSIGQARDIAEMVALQPQWQLDYQQLSRGRFQGHIVNASLPGLHLTQESSNRSARQQGQLFKDDIGLLLADSSRGPCRFHGQVAHQHTVMLGPAGELDLLTPDECHMRAILMPRSAFMGLLWQIHPRAAEQAGDAHRTIQLTPHESRRLRELIDLAMQAVLAAPDHLLTNAAARQMQDAIMLAWHDVLAARGKPERVGSLTRNSRRLMVERSCHYVREHLAEPPTMLALCRLMGASPRKLAYCFQDVLGMSPARYLRLMRLNGVHRALRVNRHEGGTDTVQDIAARWGFWHMGAFAGAYKAMFGQLPSETLCSASTSPETVSKRVFHLPLNY